MWKVTLKSNKNFTCVPVEPMTVCGFQRGSAGKPQGADFTSHEGVVLGAFCSVSPLLNTNYRADPSTLSGCLQSLCVYSLKAGWGKHMLHWPNLLWSPEPVTCCRIRHSRV